MYKFGYGYRLDAKPVMAVVNINKKCTYIAAASQVTKTCIRA